MKNGMKLLVVSMALVMGISVGASVYAADNSKPVDKSAKAPAPVTAVAKVKLSQQDVTQIVLKAHQDAKVLGIQLNKNVYNVKISTAKGDRILLVGGNTGKILKDNAVAGTPVTAPAAKATAPPAKTK
ncbi:MAG TPA: hypothetical protein DDW65_07710 [Firmicutes bacterium]|jgi:hypothetical protein|nr:hypothetical protein [Bacillota bacterium]